MTIRKYSGAGNSFVMLDSFAEDIVLSTAQVTDFCREYSTDGLIILRPSPEYDFAMEFFNPDGSSGMMCGNGGRCITLLSSRIGIRPRNGEYYEFEAPDGAHKSWILRDDTFSSVVKLSMKYPDEVRKVIDGYFTDTGTRHFVKFVPDIKAVDVDAEGRLYRNRGEFSPQGANVNFVQILREGEIHVRTFEKGVEAETLSCGTGVTASAFVYNHLHGQGKSCPASIRVNTTIASFSVEISQKEVFLTGPVEIIS